MISPIAFHPPSVLFEIPSHAELLEKVGVRSMISEVIDELLQIATSQGCVFDENFKEKTIHDMSKPSDTPSIMYQDYMSKRPMEVETYLGSPVKLAQEAGVRAPRIETLYALLHHCNIVNQQRPAAQPGSPHPPSGPTPPPRQNSAPLPRPHMNGSMHGPMGPMGPMNGPVNGNGVHGMRGGRNPPMGPPMRRGPMNGYPPPRNSSGYHPRGPPPNQLSRRGSFEGNDLEEFSHVVLYDDIPEGGIAPGYGEMPNGGIPSPSELALRERELNLRQKELQLREQEYHMRRGPRKPPPSHRGGFDDDEEDDDEFIDPPPHRGPPLPPIDPDNFDMMSVTSRRNRKAPSLSQIRKDPESGAMGKGGPRPSHGYGGRPGPGRNRSSTQLIANVPGMHDSLLDNPMMAYSSNRYGTVDRKAMADDSRANSLTASRLNDMQGPGGHPGMNGAYPTPAAARRISQSPAHPFQPSQRMSRRPSPPEDGYPAANGMQPNGGPSPPGMMRQPVPRYPPGQGNAVAPQQVEQYAGVSNSHPPKGPMPKIVRSLTGSASASAGSGDSGASTQVDSENSAHSSQSSLGPQHALGGVHAQPIGVR